MNFICLLWWMVCTPEDDWCFYFPLGSGWVTPCKDQGTSFVKHRVALPSGWPTVLKNTVLLDDWIRIDIPKSSSIIPLQRRRLQVNNTKTIILMKCILYSVVHILYLYLLSQDTRFIAKLLTHAWSKNSINSFYQKGDWNKKCGPLKCKGQFGQKSIIGC